MLSGIRTYIGTRYLHNELSRNPLDRRITNISNARNIGIIYVLNDPSEYDVVSAFVSDLQKDHKEVKALGFVKNKNLVTRFLPKLSYDFFSGKGVNWFYKPVDVKVKDFVEKDFDILIDLSLNDNLTMKYISGFSRARCRVGNFNEKYKDCYDLMININGDLSMSKYIEQIMHYLTIINNSNAEQK